MVERITIFGLGEAGSHIAAGLVAAGVDVAAFDPAAVPTPAGVIRHDEPEAAVGGAAAVFSITTAADAQAAIAQAWDRLKRGTLYADLSTAPASLKADLNDTATMRGLAFADVALMAPVPSKGLATPCLAAGGGAQRYADLVNGLGGSVEVVSATAGDAATRKLLRSVFVKGLTGVLIEALRAADAAGHGEWLRDHLNSVVTDADETLLVRLVAGTATHTKRRIEEMQHAATLLDQLGIEPIMTRSTVANLETVETMGVPGLGHRDS